MGFWKTSLSESDHQQNMLTELRVWAPDTGDAEPLYRLSAACLMGMWRL